MCSPDRFFFLPLQTLCSFPCSALLDPLKDALLSPSSGSCVVLLNSAAGGTIIVITLLYYSSYYYSKFSLYPMREFHINILVFLTAVRKKTLHLIHRDD